jgi:hypothetical protein
LLIAGASTAAFSLLVFCFVLASRHAFGSNSDDATLVLQGQSMSSGHLTLQGWDLSYDSFWTVDVLFYALGVRILGVTPLLLNLVPAIIAALLVVVAILVTRQGRRDRGFFAGAAVIVALLALPGPALAYFLLQGGWHAATTLWCLLIFAGVSKSSGRWQLAGATALVAAGLLGDLLTLTLVVAPLVLAGAVAARRERSWRACSRHLVAVLGGGVLALVVRGLALVVGTFAIGSRSVLATGSQLHSNLTAIPSQLAGLFGVTGFVGGTATTSIVLRIANGLLFTLVLAAVGVAFIHIAKSLFSRQRARVESSEWSNLDDLLAIAFVCDLVAYTLFSTFSYVDFARYLLPGLVFISVLAARMTGRIVRRGIRLNRVGLAVLGAVVLAACATDFLANSVGPNANQEARSLSSFLLSKNLHSGVGDYWSSSIVTVDSDDVVAVRPVDLLPASGTLTRYTLQSAASWYTGTAFTFFVYDTAHVWHDVTAPAAEKTFGPPSQIYDVGTYRVLVYAKGFHVAP